MRRADRTQAGGDCRFSIANSASAKRKDVKRKDVQRKDALTFYVFTFLPGIEIGNRQLQIGNAVLFKRRRGIQLRRHLLENRSEIGGTRSGKCFRDGPGPTPGQRIRLNQLVFQQEFEVFEKRCAGIMIPYDHSGQFAQTITRPIVGVTIHIVFDPRSPRPLTGQDCLLG